MIRIAHVGGWGRNYGDLALQDGQMRVLREDSEQPLEFLPIHCQQTEFHPDLIDRLNETCDLMILGGGGMIFHRPEDSSRSGWQFNIALEDLDRIRIPIAVYAVGYNPFHFDSQKLLPVAMEHLKATQDRALMFSVRNNGSRNALIKGGLNPERIEILPDPGMYVPSYPLTLPQSANVDLKIGLNWAGDRPHFRFPEPWEENRLGLIDALCGAFLELASDYPSLQVYFIPHLENRIDSDVWELFSERLGDRILNLEDDVARMFPPSRAQAGFLADTYKQMDISIGMRGHANIIPFGMNTPLLGLGSHDKVGFFLEEVGLAENWLSTQSDTKAGGSAGIAAKIKGVLQNRSVMKQDMALQLKDCRQATQDFHKRMFAAI